MLVALMTDASIMLSDLTVQQVFEEARLLYEGVQPSNIVAATDAPT